MEIKWIIILLRQEKWRGNPAQPVVESDFENVQRSRSDSIMCCGVQADFTVAFFLPGKRAGSITALERIRFSKNGHAKK